jgi:hypothetical protein
VKDESHHDAENRKWIDAEKTADVKAQGDPARRPAHAFKRVHENQAGMHEKGKHTGVPDLIGER